MKKAIVLCAFVSAAVALFSPPRACSEENPASPPRTERAWTLEEARAQLVLNPSDSYLQYVALQMARREGDAGEVNDQIRRPARGRGELDLFSLFSGALAVQESLQLEEMRAEADHHADEGEGVDLATLTGPEIESHPWDDMLAEQANAPKPAISKMAYCVPEDYCYVGFASMNRMLEVLDTSDLWGTHLLSQGFREARSQETGERVKAQLAIETNPLLRPIYDMVIDEVAVAGSDVFLREGCDVTLLFRLKQPELFKARMDEFLANAEKAHKDAKRSTATYRGVQIVQLATPDRGVCVYSAWPRPDLHVRGNSRAAFERILDAIDGKDAQGAAVRRLGDSKEFAYIRTLMPADPAQEDGFIYLSDPFIRVLVGPKLKITESRRMVCYNHLRMIGHAALMFQTDFGRAPKSLEELEATECLPAVSGLECPDGGKLSLSVDGTAGICSRHNTARFLTPCSEIPLEKVTSKEAELYNRFVSSYKEYWRRWFDPIALRIKITPQRYKLDTLILPLLDNSIYTGLSTSLGGDAPQPLDALPVPRRNVFSLAVQLNKRQLLSKVDKEDVLGDLAESLGYEDEVPNLDVFRFIEEGLGDRIAFNMYDAAPLVDFSVPEFFGMLVSEQHFGSMDAAVLPISFLVTSLNAPVYFSVPVRDAAIVDAFLTQLDALLAAKARQPAKEEGWIQMEGDFWTLPSGDGQAVRCYAIKAGPIKWRLFWARIGDGLYVASKKFILDDIIALNAQRAKAPAEAPAALGPAAHAMAKVRAENWSAVLEDYLLGWEENNREACLNNVAPISNFVRAYPAAALKNDGAIQRRAAKFYGTYLFCPDGGSYRPLPDGKSVACSIHGTPSKPLQPVAPPSECSMGKLLRGFGGMTATLTFRKDGLHATVTIERR